MRNCIEDRAAAENPVAGRAPTCTAVAPSMQPVATTDMGCARESSDARQCSSRQPSTVEYAEAGADIDASARRHNTLRGAHTRSFPSTKTVGSLQAWNRRRAEATATSGCDHSDVKPKRLVKKDRFSPLRRRSTSPLGLVRRQRKQANDSDDSSGNADADDEKDPFDMPACDPSSPCLEGAAPKTSIPAESGHVSHQTSCRSFRSLRIRGGTARDAPDTNLTTASSFRRKRRSLEVEENESDRIRRIFGLSGHTSLPLQASAEPVAERDEESTAPDKEFDDSFSGLASGDQHSKSLREVPVGRTINKSAALRRYTSDSVLFQHATVRQRTDMGKAKVPYRRRKTHSSVRSESRGEFNGGDESDDSIMEVRRVPRNEHVEEAACYYELPPILITSVRYIIESSEEEREYCDKSEGWQEVRPRIYDQDKFDYLSSEEEEEDEEEEVRGLARSLSQKFDSMGGDVSWGHDPSARKSELDDGKAASSRIVEWRSPKCAGTSGASKHEAKHEARLSPPRILSSCMLSSRSGSCDDSQADDVTLDTEDRREQSGDLSRMCMKRLKASCSSSSFEGACVQETQSPPAWRSYMEDIERKLAFKPEGDNFMQRYTSVKRQEFAEECWPEYVEDVNFAQMAARAQAAYAAALNAGKRASASAHMTSSPECPCERSQRLRPERFLANYFMDPEVFAVDAEACADMLRGESTCASCCLGEKPSARLALQSVPLICKLATMRAVHTSAECELPDEPAKYLADALQGLPVYVQKRSCGDGERDDSGEHVVAFTQAVATGGVGGGEVVQLSTVEAVARYQAVRAALVRSVTQVGAPNDAGEGSSGSASDMTELSQVLRAHGLPPRMHEEGESLVYLAATYGDVTALSLLAEARANLNEVQQEGLVRRSALEVAATFGRESVVTFLVENGAFFGRALHYAAKVGHACVVKRLLEAGASPLVRFNGYAPLCLAVIGSHMSVVEQLLRAGASLDSPLCDRVCGNLGVPPGSSLLDYADNGGWGSKLREIALRCARDAEGVEGEEAGAEEGETGKERGESGERWGGSSGYLG